jgi:Zn-dependent protease with chaperone function
MLVRFPLLLGALLGTVSPLLAQKTQGPIDYVRDSVIYIDGQPVVADGATKFKGVKSLAEIQVGYWTKAEGKRRADNVIVASKIEARPNKLEGNEGQIIDITNQIEKLWVDNKMMFEPIDSTKVKKIGDILTSGPEVDRANRIMDRLRPAHIPKDAVRVHVVKTDEWNASAMANGAVWVYTGLMSSFDDDELALVLGHELAHYTYEHSRRKGTGAKNTIGQILAVGSQVAGAAVGGTAGQLAAMGAGLGASAVMTGYSREFEDQADRVGLRYAWEGGFDVKKGPGLWQKFKDKYGETDKFTNFFQGDHSRPTERIKNIQRQIDMHYQGTAPARQ